MKFNSFLLTTASVASFLLPTLTQAMDRDDHEAKGGGSTPTSAPHAVSDEVSAADFDKIIKEITPHPSHPGTLSLGLPGLVEKTGLSAAKILSSLPKALNQVFDSAPPDKIKTLELIGTKDLKPVSPVLKLFPPLKGLENLKLVNFTVAGDGEKIAVDSLELAHCKVNSLDSLKCNDLVASGSIIHDLSSVLGVEGLRTAHLSTHNLIKTDNLPAQLKENSTLEQVSLYLGGSTLADLKKLVPRMAKAYPNLKTVSASLKEPNLKEKEELFERGFPERVKVSAGFNMLLER